jgi:hypothetical protein
MPDSLIERQGAGQPRRGGLSNFLLLHATSCTLARRLRLPLCSAAWVAKVINVHSSYPPTWLSMPNHDCSAIDTTIQPRTRTVRVRMTGQMAEMTGQDGTIRQRCTPVKE